MYCLVGSFITLVDDARESQFPVRKITQVLQNYATTLVFYGCDAFHIVGRYKDVQHLNMYLFPVSRAYLVFVASQARDNDTSWIPGLIFGF